MDSQVNSYLTYIFVYEVLLSWVKDKGALFLQETNQVNMNILKINNE